MRNEKVISDIMNNYIRNEENIVNQLYFTTTHGTTIGGFREDVWREMFRQMIPGKFVIEQSVFIIDSGGAVSNEVDLAIFDETYTPYIFRYGRLKFLPIEAVAVVIECKSSSINNDHLTTWVKNIAALKTSNKSYARFATGIAEGQKAMETASQTATRPLRILCKLGEKEIQKELESGIPMFDIRITAIEKKKQLEVEYYDRYKSLKDWYLELNHANHDNLSEKNEKVECDGKILEQIFLNEYQVEKQGEEVSLLSFNFQLNQLLMLINNPILFPHMAYAEMFNKKSEGRDIDE